MLKYALIACLLSTPSFAASHYKEYKDLNAKEKVIAKHFLDCLKDDKSLNKGPLDVPPDMFYNSIGNCEPQALKLKAIIGPRTLFKLEATMFMYYIKAVKDYMESPQPTPSKPPKPMPEGTEKL